MSTPVVAPKATATPVDAESQMDTKSSVTANAAYSDSDPKAGKPLGIAMFSLLIIAFVFTFLVPIISFIALIATIVIASVITCNCCCAGDFNLPTQVKKYATATLVSLCLMFVMQVIWAVSVIVALTNDMESSGTGSISSSALNASMTSAGEYIVTGFAHVLLFQYA